MVFFLYEVFTDNFLQKFINNNANNNNNMIFDFLQLLLKGGRVNTKYFNRKLYHYKYQQRSQARRLVLPSTCRYGRSVPARELPAGSRGLAARRTTGPTDRANAPLLQDTDFFLFCAWITSIPGLDIELVHAFASAIC